MVFTFEQKRRQSWTKSDITAMKRSEVRRSANHETKKWQSWMKYGKTAMGRRDTGTQCSNHWEDTISVETKVSETLRKLKSTWNVRQNE